APTRKFLTVTHTPAGRAEVKVTVNQEGTEESVGKFTRYRYRGPVIRYRRGDDLTAELSVTPDGQGRARTLQWNRGRSHLYQFEHLRKAPRLYTGNQPGAVQEALAFEDVQPAIPPLPDL